jgi:hypothetical protein
MNPEPTPLDLPATSPPTPTSGAASEAICDAGSPRAPANNIELHLDPSSKHSRQLIVLLLTAQRTLWVDLRVNGALCSSAHTLLAKCYLAFNDGCSYLCLDDATFALSVEEAPRIRATFEPLGLRVRETDQ